MTTDFFEVPEEHSLIKGQLVSKYFDGWATIIQKYSKNICYQDLFCGKGAYDDGTDSTPLLVLEKAHAKLKVRDSIKLIFNDMNEESINILKDTVDKKGYNFKQNPNYFSQMVNPSDYSKLTFLEFSLPTLSILDPFGYADITPDFIAKLIKGFGSEVILFFNFNQISRDLTNGVVRKKIENFFGVEAQNELNIVGNYTGDKKREKIEELYEKILIRKGAKFVSFFPIQKTGSNRTSHHIVFVTKSEKGFELWKEISKNLSSEIIGPPQMKKGISALSLFGPEDEHAMISKFLLVKYSGAKGLAGPLIKEAARTSKYTYGQIKKAFILLEREGQISTDRHLNNKFNPETFPDSLEVKFKK